MSSVFLPVNARREIPQQCDHDDRRRQNEHERIELFAPIEMRVPRHGKDFLFQIPVSASVADFKEIRSVTPLEAVGALAFRAESPKACSTCRCCRPEVALDLQELQDKRR